MKIMIPASRADARAGAADSAAAPQDHVNGRTAIDEVMHQTLATIRRRFYGAPPLADHAAGQANHAETCSAWSMRIARSES
ncbi:MAG: hypothetical protein EXS37_07325 [Opitutus sp.]|nr:hypothetical protein [Opitutus sp.]